MLSLKTFLASYSLANKLDSQKCEEYISQLKIEGSDSLENISPGSVKLSVVHMRLFEYRDINTFIEDCCRLLELAVRSGSQLVVFPHLMGLLPLGCEPKSNAIVMNLINDVITTPQSRMGDHGFRQRFAQIVDRMSDFVYDCYYSVFLRLAKRYNIYIAAGSTYAASARGVFCRSFLFSPDQDHALFQDKLTLSPYEYRLGLLTGNEIKIMETRLGKIAILSDTDISFYECCKAAKALGADLIVSPAFGYDIYGGSPEYNSSRMAAQQHGVLVARSSFYSTGFSAFGSFPGSSGVYVPAELSRNQDGIIVHTTESDESGGVLSAQVNYSSLQALTDPYTCFKNTQFAALLLRKIYPEHFIAQASRVSGQNRYISRRLEAELGSLDMLKETQS